MVGKVKVKGLNSVRYVYSLILSSLLSSTSLEGRLEDVDPIALTSQGQLLGKFGESRNGRDYIEFLGIPYARVPQTFYPAMAPDRWDGLRNATEYGSKCMQFDRMANKVVGSEDCLFLNVFRPADMSEVLPIMVYIHGGAFAFSSGDTYGAKYFMDQNVILITFNYRLGALGFLNVGDDAYPGNLGMKDQVLALRWIRDNIHAFGGDPNKVTIFGDSSGAASVSYHILSPMSRGLFSRAISMSGNALCPWAIVPNPKGVAKRLAASVGCPTKKAKYLVACLMNKEAKEIVEAQQELAGWDDEFPVVPFAPSVEESTTSNGEVFLPHYPERMLETGNFNKVPWISGVNSHEGATLYSAIILNSTELTDEFNRNWAKMAPFALGYKESDSMQMKATNDIREYYFDSEPISLETRDNLTNMFSDRNFFHCNRKASLAFARYSSVYLYYFTQEGIKSWLDVFKIPKELGFKGVVHSDELQFFFNMEPFPEIKNGSELAEFSSRVVALWSSFAKTGMPYKIWGEDVVEWNPVQLSEMSGLSPVKYFQVEEKAKIIMEPFTERLDFWESLPLNYTNIHINPQNP